MKAKRSASDCDGLDLSRHEFHDLLVKRLGESCERMLQLLPYPICLRPVV